MLEMRLRYSFAHFDGKLLHLDFLTLRK